MKAVMTSLLFWVLLGLPTDKKPHASFNLIRSWIPCAGRTIINGEEILCRICGAVPNRARVIGSGEIEAYCAIHKPSSAFYSRK